MPAYFLDASALVKRYAAETGSQWIETLCQSTEGNIIGISQASTVETVAALCRKVWTTQTTITSADRDRLIAIFRQDILRDYSVTPVTQDIYTHAGDLCAKHRLLRAYDAVQLACALALRDALAQGNIALTFVTGDGNLGSAAQNEGFQVENPDSHP